MGLHRSPASMQNQMDFIDYKTYQNGDDLRKVDWRLYARTDRLFVKESSYDTTTRILLVLDSSSSMDYSHLETSLTKFEMGIIVAKIIALIAQRQRDPLGLTLFNDRLVSYFPRNKPSYYYYLMDQLERVIPQSQTDLPAALNQVLEKNYRGGIVVIVSDFLCDWEKSIRLMKLLRLSGHEVILFRTSDIAEQQIPFDGYVEFLDAETQETMLVNVSNIKAAYEQEVLAFRHRLYDESMAKGIFCFDIFNDTNVVDLVSFYLLQRLKARRWRAG